MSTNFEDLIGRDITANRPAAAKPGRLFFDTTLGKMQRDNGSSWDDVEGTNLTALLTTFLLQGDISPSQITSNQNDYNPTGLSTASTLRLSTDASRNITGLQGGSDGRIVNIVNVGSFNIVLKDDDGSTSTAGNRFALSGDITLAPDDGVILQYDSTSSRWRAIGKSPGASSGLVDDTAYDATTWNGDTTHAPSKNAIRDKIETMSGSSTSLVSDKKTLTSGNITTTGTSFADIASGLNITLTTGARRCLVGLIAWGNNNTASATDSTDVEIDGTRIGGTFGLMSGKNTDHFSLAFTFLTDVLTAGSHTFKPQWKVDSGTGTLFASSTAPCIFFVQELPLKDPS